MALNAFEILSTEKDDDVNKIMKDEPEVLEDSGIHKAFKGTNVLITGATGFLGKLLLEKLLRSCPGINNIYVLIRPKKNLKTLERQQKLFKDPLYDRLLKENPNFTRHVHAIEGDIGQLGLGISEQDRIKVINEVNFIFHVAATVRFNEPLKTAIEINVRGTREILTLAKNCTKLKALVHVSTAFSNCLHQEIDEKFYDPPVLPGDKLIELAETIDEEVFKKIAPGLLDNTPNTYIFTKQAAEDIINKHGKGLPVAIFRPAVVISTAKEPIPGWIDNFYNIAGMVVAAMVGILHVVRLTGNSVAEVVPGDMVINACIATAWKTDRDFTNKEKSTSKKELEIPIYNYVSSEQRPLIWNDFKRYSEMNGYHCATTKMVYTYILFLTSSDFMYTVSAFFLHTVPAFIVDMIAVILRKKPMLKKAHLKLQGLSDVLNYFCCRQWKYHNKNTQRLHNELSTIDQQIFDFDMSKLDWKEYFKTYILGIRLYLLEDPIETIPQGIRKLTILTVVHYVICSILGYFILKMFWTFINRCIGS